jgi:hypothetical protein
VGSILNTDFGLAQSKYKWYKIARLIGTMMQSKEWGISGQVIKVIDFKLLAPQCCGFDLHQVP